jgi:hypothetical protein
MLPSFFFPMERYLVGRTETREKINTLEEGKGAEVKKFARMAEDAQKKNQRSLV